jgi:hypothetical protein
MSTRNWNILSNYPGFQPIEDTSTTQQHELGTMVQAKHATYGVVTFCYAKGVASTAVGDMCMIDNYGALTVRTVAATRGRVGVAMSANVANQYGWYAIEGAVPVKAGTVAAQGQVFSTATAGTVDDAAVAGSMIQGATFKSADGTPSAGYAVVSLCHPSMCGVPA